MQPSPETEHRYVLAPKEDAKPLEVDVSIEKGPGSTIPDDKGIKSRPVSVDYFTVPGWDEMMLDERLDVNGVRDKVFFIENFLDNRTKELGLKNDLDTFSAILGQVENDLGFTKFHDPLRRVNAVFKYAETLEKSATKNKEIERLIKKANQEAKQAKR